jgi:two-component system response regulator
MPGPILLVEDNPIDAKLALHALSQPDFSHEVMHVTDGIEALDYLQCCGRYANRPPGAPAMIFLDLHLPRLNGFDLLNVLQQDPQLAEIPVVIISASPDQHDIVRSLTNGAKDYVVKLTEISRFMRDMKAAGSRWAWPTRTPASDAP